MTDNASSATPASPSAADALGRIQGQRFVGRSAALDRLKEALFPTPDGDVPKVATVLGPPGIGKTTLTQRFAATTPFEDVHWVWCESIEPSVHALQEALPAPGFGQKRSLLVFDAFEHHHDLAEWFFRERFGQFGPRVSILLSSRRRLSDRLRGALALSASLVDFELGPLSDADAEALLSRLGCDPDHVPSGVAQSAGVPLSLALYATQAQNTPAKPPRISHESLVRELLATAPTPLHRRGLEALAVGRRLDDELAERLIDGRPDVYEWLRSLSFVRQTSQGLALHETLRTMIFEHLSSSAPERIHAVAQRAAPVFIEKIDRCASVERAHPLVVEMVSYRRDLPHVQTFEAGNLRQLHVRWLPPDERHACIAAIAAHEDAASADRLSLASPELGVLAIRDPRSQLVGIVGALRLGESIPRGFEDDPIVQATQGIRKEQKWQSADVLLRWAMTPDGYQSITPHLAAALFASGLVPAQLPGQRLLYAMSPPEQWDPLTEPMHVDGRLGTVDAYGRTYGLYSTDVTSRVQAVSPGRSPQTRYAELQLREVLGLPKQTMVYLDEQNFRECVLKSLPTLRRPAASDAPRFHPCAHPDAKDAQAWLRQGIEVLQSRSVDELHGNILHRAYLAAPEKQRATAAAFGLPYGTFRYQLRKAQGSLADELWRKEEAARAASS